MDMSQGKATLQRGMDVLDDATDQTRRHMRRAANNAMHGMRRAGREVNSFVRERPVETALFGAAAACLIAGLAFWFSRKD